MSTGGMPDLDRLLEDEDEESEATPESETAEDDGREHAEEGEDDGPDGEAGEGDEGVEEEAQPGRADVGGSRRSNRIRNLNRRLQESNRRNEEMQRRLEALERGGGQRQQPSPQEQQETQEQENARLALMSPEERMQYTLDKGMRSINAMMQHTQVTNLDNQDRAAFQNLATTDRLARRFAPQVEKLFQELKGQGRMTAREVILDYLIGQAARKANSTGQGRQKRRAAEREISRNRVNTGAGRSDVSSERRRGGQTLEQRLEGKLI